MRSFFSSKYRHIKRYREIINVLSKHGLGHLLELTGLSHALRIPWKKTAPVEPVGIAKRLRLVLDELGPTFIKFGQIVSTRPDILPEVYIAELELLQDQVAPTEFSEMKVIIEDELGSSLAQKFSIFNPSPIASASIGQVYEAFLFTGEHVVVKVQRAGLERLIETDLEIMYDITKWLEAGTEWGKTYGFRNIIDEFARTIRDELDYIIEAKNADRFRENFRADSSIYFPKVYWEYTTHRVLVLEYVTGIKITDTARLDKSGVNRPEAARKIAAAFFKQLLVDGFFHADPHPGNIVIADHGIIVFMDFGMVGRLDEWIKERLGIILLGFIRKDLKSVLRVLTEFGTKPYQIDQSKLQRELYYIFDKYSNRHLGEIKIGAVFRDLMNLSFSYHIRIPQELALIIRSLILLEHLVERLDPQSSLINLAKPFGPKLLKEKFALPNLMKIASNHLLNLLQNISILPENINNLLQIATAGELRITLEHHNFDNFIYRLTILGNRLSFSLIIAATIIGSSLIALKSPVNLFGQFPIAEAGFIVAVLMGIWLLISIIRSGRI